MHVASRISFTPEAHGCPYSRHDPEVEKAVARSTPRHAPTSTAEERRAWSCEPGSCKGRAPSGMSVHTRQATVHMWVELTGMLGRLTSLALRSLLSLLVLFEHSWRVGSPWSVGYCPLGRRRGSAARSGARPRAAWPSGARPLERVRKVLTARPVLSCPPSTDARHSSAK